MTDRTRFLAASLLSCLSSLTLVACSDDSSESDDTGVGGITGTGGTPGTGGSIVGPAGGFTATGGVGTGMGGSWPVATGGSGPAAGGAFASGGVTGSTGGVTGSTGGVTGTTGGTTGSTGGVTGSTGGVTGTTGGTTGDSGGMAGAPGGAPSLTGGAGGEGGSSPVGGSGGADTGGTGGSTPTGVHVQLGETFQTIRGFGINSALMPDNKTLPIDKLFSTDGPDGIGLSILRVGMTPQGTLTGKYVSEAKSRGAIVIGSTWSPPANCKTNGSTQNGGHLIPPEQDGGSCYDSWSTTIANFAQQQGLYAMSIANESDFASCPGVPVCTDAYDTTVYTAKQMVEWVKVAGPKLKAAGVKVIAPEASEWIHVWSNASGTGSLVASHPHSSDPLDCGCYSNTPTNEGCAQTCLDGNGYDYGHWLWDDQEAWNAFDILGVHEYDSQIAYAWPSDVNDGVRDKEVWQTEMSGVMHWPEQGPSTDINNGVAVAGWIHSALTVGEASAWLYWWYEAYYQNDNEGLALIQGSSTIAKRYYTLGNYSKFVRPGYVAVKVAGNDNDDVLLSAYKGEDGGVVVVAINKGSAAAEFPIAITGGTAPASVTPHVTSANQNLVAGTAIPVADGAFTASLAPKTVTSFVGN